MVVRATWGRWCSWRKAVGRWWFSGTLANGVGTAVESWASTTSGYWTPDPQARTTVNPLDLNLAVFHSSPACTYAHICTHAGMKHVGTACGWCSCTDVSGVLWKCAQCLQYYLCSGCYHGGKHSLEHEFERLDDTEHTERSGLQYECFLVCGTIYFVVG